MTSKKNQGFTLIELMVAVSLLAILASSGAAIFLRALRGTSQVEIRRTLDDRARTLINGLARFFREGVVVSLSGQTHADCLTAGSVTGDTLVVTALDGIDTTFSVSGGILSSASAQTIQLNPESVTLAHKSGLAYYFTWYCANGVPDRVSMQFNAISSGLQSDSSVNSDYVMEVTLRNVGQ